MSFPVTSARPRFRSSLTCMSRLDCCRHNLCGDCVFGVILELIAKSPSSASGQVPFSCPVEGCGVVVTGLGSWLERDAEVVIRIASMSSSTYAHRSLEIRKT